MSDIFRTLAVIVGTAFLTVSGIAVFLHFLFKELEKADDNNGF